MSGKPVAIQEAATSLWLDPWQLVRDKGKWRLGEEGRIPGSGYLGCGRKAD